MPPYLHNRPRHIVQHCLEKIDLAKSIPSHHVVSKGEGHFEVCSQTAMLDVWYKVSFGRHDATPSCTCKGWQCTRLPCKHMFAIFRHKPDWGFDNLSETYRTSPFFILDQDLIFPINNTLPGTNLPEDERMNNSSEEIDNLIIADKENLPLPKEESLTANSGETNNLLNVHKENLPIPSCFKKTVAAQCRELMNQAKSLTFIVNDTDILVEVRKSLENCVKIMEKSSPKASNGMILEQDGSSKPPPKNAPKAQPKKKLLQQRLPLATRKSKYSGRVGQAANNMKQGWHVDPLKSTENCKCKKVELEVEIVGDSLPEDCHSIPLPKSTPCSPSQNGNVPVITTNDQSPDPPVTVKPAVTQAPRYQPKESPNPLHMFKPLPTNNSRVTQGKSSLKRGRQDIALHSTVKSKWAKLDVEIEVKGDNLSEASPPPTSNKKDNKVIIDENSSDPDIWIDYRDQTAGNKITLYADSKKLILNPRGWLHDSEVEAAQKLLKMKFPLFDGLEDPAITGNLVTPATSEFVQIINTGLHWVCISTLSCSIGVVKVYDSLFGKPNTKAIQHSCRMLLHRGKSVKIINEKVQKQQGSNDCALFAIAFATTLCHGNNPTTTRYDQKAMRNHLVDCLEAKDMTEFPTTEKRVPLVLVPVSSKTVPVYCTCRLPDDKTKYVQCEGPCSEWYHPACANIPQSVIRNTNKRWMCFKCRSEK